MVSLHDLLFDLAIRLSQCHIGETKALHNLLVEAYANRCRTGWTSGPNDGYFFTHLRQHLIAAGRAGEFAELLHELPWLETKNEAGLTFDLPGDFGEAMKALPLDDVRQQTLSSVTRKAVIYPSWLRCRPGIGTKRCAITWRRLYGTRRWAEPLLGSPFH